MAAEPKLMQASIRQGRVQATRANPTPSLTFQVILYTPAGPVSCKNQDEAAAVAKTFGYDGIDVE